LRVGIRVALWALLTLTVVGCDDASTESEPTGPPPAGGAPSADAVSDYCRCMLSACHSPFHDRWGNADSDALAACDEETSALLSGTEGDTSGASVACRMHFCDLADETGEEGANCPAAIGDRVCR
jgi:hypothetical protein